jgi:hypothetical protein
MPTYTFTTREFGPNAKNDTLTYQDLDYSLLFLSESITETSKDILSGSNYLFVKAGGTPFENATELSSSYVQAKNSSPSSNNRITILAGPGKYQFASNFNLDTQYINILSVTGDRDISITGSGTINITANDVYVKGIDVGTKNFTIANSLSLLKVVNCKGGDLSFGGTADLPLSGSLPSSSILVNGTFIDCEGGDLSFGGNGIAGGIFENCIGGEGAFGFDTVGGTFINCEGGDFSFGGAEGDLDASYFENCTGGEGSFTILGNILDDTIIKDCTGGLYSFSKYGTIQGDLYGCRLTSGSFNSPITSGSLRLCIDGTNQIVNLP